MNSDEDFAAADAEEREELEEDDEDSNDINGDDEEEEVDHGSNEGDDDEREAKGSETASAGGTDGADKARLRTGIFTSQQQQRQWKPRRNNGDDEEDEEEEVDKRFILELPDPVEEVETFEMALPGHGSEKQTIVVNLSEPKKSFEHMYSKQLDALRKDTILRRLEGDKVAIRAFLNREKEAEQEHQRRAQRQLDDGEDADKDGEDDDEAEEVDADEDGMDAQQKGGYVILENDGDDDVDAQGNPRKKSKAIANLEERLLRRRRHPYWLPHLLANDMVHFEHVCRAMYGLAVPLPPLPPAKAPRSAKGGAGTNADRRQSSRQAVSFQMGSHSDAGDRGSATHDGGEDDDEDDNGDGDGVGEKDADPEDEDEDDEQISVADPARKPLDFYLKSDAFGGDTNTTATSGRTIGENRGNNDEDVTNGEAAGSASRDSPSHTLVAVGPDDAINGEDLPDGSSGGGGANGHAEGAAPDTPRTQAVKALLTKPRTASIVPAGSLSHKPSSSAGAAAPSLAGLVAFTDATYPLYIVWETKSEAWQLLDVHPDLFLFRMKEAERRERRAAVARKARLAAQRLRRRQQPTGAGKTTNSNGGADDNDDNDDNDDDHDDDDDEADEEAEEAEEAAADSEGDADSAEHEGEDGDDLDEEAVARRKRGKANNHLPRFEKESMIVMDALMLAATRSPAALRLMLLQNPSSSSSSTGNAHDQANSGVGADEEEEEQEEGARTRREDFAAQAAQTEKLISLQNLQTWMEADLTVGFPILSAVYVALLSVRALDAPRLPYPLATGLLLDFNVFFTEAYAFSYPSAPRLLGSHQSKDMDLTTRRLEGLASPRSQAARETMQALLCAGIVPRTAIALAHLTTPETIQLVLWLAMMIPPALLRAWGKIGRQVTRQYLEDVQNGNSRGGGADSTAREEEAEDEAADEADDDDDDDDDAEPDIIFGDNANDEVTEEAVLGYIVVRARREERRREREARRTLRALKKQLRGTAPAPKKSSLSVCRDERKEEEEEEEEQWRRRNGAAPQQRPRAEDDAEDDEATDVSDAPPVHTWKSLTTAIARLQASLAAARADDVARKNAFYPGPLLLQTVQEIRRRTALEKTGKGASLLALTFVVEKPLGRFMKTVEDGKPTGDALVTSSFHVKAATSSAMAFTAAAAGERSVTCVPFCQTNSTHSNGELLSLAAVSGHDAGGKISAAHTGTGTFATTIDSPTTSILLQKQILYQSDLVLLLLALTTTKDDKPKPHHLQEWQQGGGDGAAVPGQSLVCHGGTGIRPSVSSTSVVMTKTRHITTNTTTHTATPWNGALPHGEEEKVTATAAAIAEASARTGFVADGHTELFTTVLLAKLAKQDSTARVGRAAASLLDKVRAGCFRLLYLALPRFQQPITVQLLCNASPLHTLLGSNERCPLTDLVVSWASEAERRPFAHHGGTFGSRSVGGSHPSITACSAAGAKSTASLMSLPLPVPREAFQYVDIFACTFWSELAYRLEAGVYPAGTQEMLRRTLPMLVDKAAECVEAYVKVLATLTSGKMLKHSVIHRAVLGLYAAFDTEPQGKKAFSAMFPILDATNTDTAAGAAAASGSAAAVSSTPTADATSLVTHLAMISPYSEEYKKDVARIHALFDPLPMAPRTIFTPELLHALLFTTSELDAVAVRYVTVTHHVTSVREGGPFALHPRKPTNAAAMQRTPSSQSLSPHSCNGLAQLRPSPAAGTAGEGVSTFPVSKYDSAHVGLAQHLSAPQPLGPSQRDSSSSSIRHRNAAVPPGTEVSALEYAIRTKNLRVARLLVLLGTKLDETVFGGACTLETLAERCLDGEDVESLRLMARRRRDSMRTDPECLFGGIRVA